MTKPETNGRQKGRAVPPLPEFTFSTGITVKLRRVSPYLGDAIRRAFPPPKPPIADTEIGPERNEADPDYIRAVAEWEQLVALKATDLMLERGIEVEVDQKALDEVRESMQTLGIALPDEATLKLSYIKFVCVGSDTELEQVIMALRGQSEVTEEAVQAHVDTFSSNVPG